MEDRTVRHKHITEGDEHERLSKTTNTLQQHAYIQALIDISHGHIGGHITHFVDAGSLNVLLIS